MVSAKPSLVITVDPVGIGLIRLCPNGIGVGLGMGVGVGVGSGVCVGVGVAVGSGVCVGVGVGVAVGSGVGVKVGPGVAVCVGVDSGARFGSGVCVGSGAGVVTAVGSEVGSGVAVGSCVGAGDGVDVSSGAGASAGLGMGGGATATDSALGGRAGSISHATASARSASEHISHAAARRDISRGAIIKSETSFGWGWSAEYRGQFTGWTVCYQQISRASGRCRARRAILRNGCPKAGLLMRQSRLIRERGFADLALP